MTLYLVQYLAGSATVSRAVAARTPQAAARKVTGKQVRLDPQRPTAKGALLSAPFATGSGLVGSVEWPQDPGVRLVRYPGRSTVFFVDPEKWADGEKHPIEIVTSESLEKP